jgi:hypothetical protein
MVQRAIPWKTRNKNAKKHNFIALTFPTRIAIILRDSHRKLEVKAQKSIFIASEMSSLWAFHSKARNESSNGHIFT